MNSPDVVVVGAGISGLVAALELTRGGARVQLIEARQHPGGRVCTQPGRPPLELGAEFLPVDGPAARELRSAGAALTPAPEHHVSLEGGEWVRFDFEPAMDAIRQAAAVVGAGDAAGGDADIAAATDLPLADALARTNASAHAVALAIRHAEGYHAAPAVSVSTAWVARMQRLADDGSGEEVQVPGGLGPLIHGLADRLPPGAIRYGTAVRALELKDGVVRLGCAGDGGPGTVFARRVVITCPPPVLGALLPPELLPPRHLAALAKVRMGAVVKLVLRLRKAAPLPAGPKFFHAPGPFPTWWTGPDGASGLVAWAGGPAAEALAGLRQDELVSRALAQLALMTNRPVAQLEGLLAAVAWHDWPRDALARGAYSHATVGGVDACDTLAESIDDTIFIAGEATSEATGMVDGAWAAGRRVAAQVLRDG
jgi:monoamine oxidase